MPRATPYARTNGTRIAVPERLYLAFAAERDRWVLWLPVALGAGIAGYFALPMEPDRFVGPALTLASLAGLGLLRRSVWPRLALVLALFAALGFSAAQWRSLDVDAPVWGGGQVTSIVEGRVVSVEPAPQGPRVVLEAPAPCCWFRFGSAMRLLFFFN